MSLYLSDSTDSFCFIYLKMALLKAKKLFQEFLKQFNGEDVGPLIDYLRLVIDDYDENPKLFISSE